MYRYFAPVAGLFVFVLALFTIPYAGAETGTAPVDLSAGLTMIPVIGDIILQIKKWLPVVFQVVGAFSMIAAMTANETDDKVVNVILKVINFLGMNFGTAKNDPDIGVNRHGSSLQP